MSTLVCFHAHPDDETLSMGGTMAKAAAAGHRVVLVVATRGENGEVPEGFLAPGEPLWQRRMTEVDEAARILGVARVEFLGYVDSGMMGTPENDAPASFWRADVDEAARRLAAILEEERPDVLTAYDERGGYGHPDHIQVHRVGMAAARLVPPAKMYMTTINRDHILRLRGMAAERGEDLEGAPDENTELGVAEERITATVDVRDVIAQKRAALVAHASQITEDSFFLRMSPDVFERAFGQEWFIRVGGPLDGDGRPLPEHDLFDGLADGAAAAGSAAG